SGTTSKCIEKIPYAPLSQSRNPTTVISNECEKSLSLRRGGVPFRARFDVRHRQRQERAFGLPKGGIAEAGGSAIAPTLRANIASSSVGVNTARTDGAPGRNESRTPLTGRRGVFP